MTSKGRKFVLDTHLFIDAFHDEHANAALARFHHGFAPFEHLSVIVAQELRAGARSATDRELLEHHVLDVFERRARVIVPSDDAWHRSGDVLAAMAMREGLELARVSKSFANDVLIALSCRESGCALITKNEKDFRRIARYVQFDFVEPWP